MTALLPGTDTNHVDLPIATNAAPEAICPDEPCHAVRVSPTVVRSGGEVDPFGRDVVTGYAAAIGNQQRQRAIDRLARRLQGRDVVGNFSRVVGHGAAPS